MRTLRFQIRADQADLKHHSGIAECAAILQGGGLVAIPTETVYGLAGNAFDVAAVDSIFAAKERPAWDPLIVHVSNLEMISRVASDVPELVHRLAERFWPGPLTVLLEKSPQVPATVTAGRNTVAVRIPAHPVARALIAATNLPLAAPSANRFGHTSPTTAEHVLSDLEGRIDALLDAGPTTMGVESTVIDPLQMPPLILRPGGVTREQLEAAIGPVRIYSAPSQPTSESLASPGLGARHYAPRAKLVLIEGAQQSFLEAVRKHVQEVGGGGECVGVMAPEKWLHEQALAAGGVVIFDWGPWGDWPKLAQGLFAGLRHLDKLGASVILCPLPPENGIGMAVRDRLLRAAI